MEGVYARLAGLEAPLPGWPEAGSEAEDLVFACATLLFVEPASTSAA
jgi:hypothetical protein